MENIHTFNQQRKYEILPLLFMTVGAVVNGAATCNAVATWGYQNEKLLSKLGLPLKQCPSNGTLQKIYAKVDIESFERVLKHWLSSNFPFTKIVEQEIFMGNVSIPGVRLLRPYQNIASEVIAKLR